MAHEPEHAGPHSEEANERAARNEARQLIASARELKVTPEELRSAVQQGGEWIMEVRRQLRELGGKHEPEI